MGLLAELVRSGLASNDISQAELARQAPCSRAHLSRFLSGKGHLRSDVVERLLSVLLDDQTVAPTPKPLTAAKSGKDKRCATRRPKTARPAASRRERK